MKMNSDDIQLRLSLFIVFLLTLLALILYTVTIKEDVIKQKESDELKSQITIIENKLEKERLIRILKDFKENILIVENKLEMDKLVRALQDSLGMNVSVKK